MRSHEASVFLRHRWMLLFAAIASPAMAEGDTAEIRAVAAVIPPLVMEDQGHLTGFSVELWNEVATKLGARTTYRVVPNTVALLNALREGESDIAVMGMYYTIERDRDFDFTYSTLNAGLQVMVPSTVRAAQASPLVAFLKLLFSRSMLYWLIAAVMVLLVPAHVIWLLDRKSTDGVSPSERYFPGVLYVMTWASEAMLGQAQTMPRRRLAHLVGNLWLFAGVVFVAFFTAQMTATLTLDQIRGVINGPDDLPGKSVAAAAGSPSVTYLRGVGARVQEYTSADELLSALLSGKVEAVVAAAPPLQYFAAHDGAGKVRMVGPEFRKEDLMFVVPLNSPLRRRVNGALVALREDGTYQRLYEKWFGKE